MHERAKTLENHELKIYVLYVLKSYGMVKDLVHGIWSINVNINAKDIHERYMNDEISKEDFLMEYHNPNNYQPQTQYSNRGHKYE